MNKSKKTKIWMFSILGIIATTLVLFSMRQYPKKLEKFHEKEINGIVTYIYSSTGGTRIKVNSAQTKHLIFTEYNENINSFFYRFIAVGDSIYKSQHDEYVHVFKGEKETLFKTKIEKPKR